jgi:hypothetical protein
VSVLLAKLPGRIICLLVKRLVLIEVDDEYQIDNNELQDQNHKSLRRASLQEVRGEIHVLDRLLSGEVVVESLDGAHGV